MRAIDPLADSFHSMDSGTMTREEVQLLHNQAMDAKKDLKLAYEAYWQLPVQRMGPWAWVHQGSPEGLPP